MTAEQARLATWAILELMGHRRLAGYLQEQEVAGAGFLRLDIPGRDGQPIATQLYSPSSVYAIHPVAEEIARAVALRSQPEPVTAWELRALKPPEPAGSGEEDDDDSTDQSDWGL